MRRQVRSAIGQVCEELLMNALYDAPVDADGKPMFAEVDPHDRTRDALAAAGLDPLRRDRGRRSRSRCAIGSAASRRTRSSRTSTSASTRRTRSIARRTARVSASTSSRTRRRRYVVNVAYGIATEVVCTFDRGAKAPLRLVGVFVHPGRRRDAASSGPDAAEIGRRRTT